MQSQNQLAPVPVTLGANLVNMNTGPADQGNGWIWYVNDAPGLFSTEPVIAATPAAAPKFGGFCKTFKAPPNCYVGKVAAVDKQSSLYLGVTVGISNPSTVGYNTQTRSISVTLHASSPDLGLMELSFS